MEIPSDGVRLNVGSGRHSLDGWVNVDLANNPAAVRPPDIIAPAWAIPLPDASVKELMAIHLFEHFYHWECSKVLNEWKRLMRKGATLVLEMPDLFKFCKNVIEGRTTGRQPDDLGLWGMYGDPREQDPLMCHRWGWTFSTLAPFLLKHGFKDCVEAPTEWHHVGKNVRDFRITAKRI